MDCPKCNAPNSLRVINTEHRDDGTHRWKRCQCGFVQRTLERPFSTKPGPIPGTTLGRTKAPGSRNGNAVLTEENVRRLREQAASGVSNVELAQIYGIAPATVSRIINRKAWAHVP